MESYLNTGCGETEGGTLVHASDWGVGAWRDNLVWKHSYIGWFAIGPGSEFWYAAQWMEHSRQTSFIFPLSR